VTVLNVYAWDENMVLTITKHPIKVGGEKQAQERWN
jgi:hypothetical protein